MTATPRMFDRRQFLTLLAKRLTPAALLVGASGAAYATWEAKRPQVTRLETGLRHLPAAFDGLTVAFLSDTHHGPFVPLEYLAEVVRMTNALRPDIVALGGDYVQRRRKMFVHFGVDHRRYIAPGVSVLADLRAPLGRFAVLGNHDHRTDPGLTRQALADAGFTDLTNTGVWLERPGGARLRIAGVDDCRTGRPRIAPALGDLRENEPCLLLTHNPDYVELIRDPRVDLVLSGHTHGGQVVLPLVGASVLPSRYGQKYRSGLVRGPAARVFVTTGIGTIGLPVRFRCPPEVAFITLRSPFV